MRVHRAIEFLTILATLAACSSPGASANAQPEAAAPAPVASEPAPAPAPVVAVNLHWDSAPLDRAYRRARSALEARHKNEVEHPRSGESVSLRVQRHDEESKVLELRYSRGKEAHARTLPPDERP